MNQAAAGERAICAARSTGFAASTRKPKRPTADERAGSEPQPGLALMRLAQGDGTPRLPPFAGSSGRRRTRLRRAALLPAYAEIMLAAGELDEARRACEELERDRARL